jgi:serine/threonine protein kinase
MSDDGGTEVRGDKPARAGFELGTQVGSYRIDARLGEGGMGVVYRATDTKLRREVAIKVLGDHLFDANARRRFQREAQMASALNHPHIVTVYDVGEHADRQYLVTELVDGGTLQDWSRTEPHRWRAIVEFMVGVADALAAAHDASILHRDVKPANILITKSGYAKLADFGLAKLVEDDEARAPGTRQTATGAVVGTAAYMSPEQALGRKLDARSDIFTFGVVLYELLAGRHPFVGESDVVMLQAVIHSQPPPLPEEIPEALRTVVDKALEKEPSDRYQSMRELVVDLRRIARKSATDRPPVAPRPTPPSRAWIPWIAVSLTLLALVAALVARRPPAVAPAEATEFVILPPDGTAFPGASGALLPQAAVSPDGRQLAFVAVGTDGVSRIWIRALASVMAKPLPDTDGGNGPFWSPDSRAIGFFARGQLRRIDVTSGSAQILAPVSVPLGGAWSPTGVIVYVPQFGSPLLSIPATGGKSTPVTRPGEAAHVSPSFLPDGRHFVYWSTTDPTNADVQIGSLGSTEAKPLLVGAHYARYAEPGYVLFTRGNSLLAQRLDTAALSVTGEPMLVAENVPSGGVGSQNGVLIYQPGGATRTQLLWTDRSGQPAGIAATAGEYNNVALSSDGTRVAFDRTGSTNRTDVWILDLQRRIATPLTHADLWADLPIWSPDGRYVAFASKQTGGLDIYRHAANLTGTDELVVQLDAQLMFPSDWSTDGKYLTYYRAAANGRVVEWTLPIGGGKPIELPHGPFNQSQGQFSPDGRWLAYVSDESGMSQVYVESFPDSAGKVPVSAGGGTQPRWSRDGKELYFLAPDRKLMAAKIAASDVLEVHGVEPLFETTLDLSAQRQTYAVAPDGRFLLNVPVSTSGAPLVVVLNWTALLKK